MAKVTEQHLGILNGKVGDYIFRRTPTGKFSVYTMKKERKKTTSEESLKNNSRFALINKFSSAVSDLYFVKEVWNNWRRVKGVKARDKIFSNNFRYCHPDCLHPDAFIVPEGVTCDIVSFTHNNDSFEIVMNPEPRFLNSHNDYFVASCLIYLNIPEKEKSKYDKPENNVFITIDKRFNSIKYNADNTFNLKFYKGSNAFSKINDYKRVRVYCTLTYLSKTGKFLWTSSDSFLYKGHALDEARFGFEKAYPFEKERKFAIGLNNIKPDYFNFKIR